MGYKANTIMEFVLNYQPQIFTDCVVSKSGSHIELLGGEVEDWRATLIYTGIWQNIGERLMAVKKHVENEEFFLANHSDGLSDVDLDALIAWFKQSGKVGCFLAVRAPFSFHLPEFDDNGTVTAMRIQILACGSMSATLCSGRRFSIMSGTAKSLC